MSEKSTVPPILNKTMKFVLRSPLHKIISRYILLITFRGKKSGKTYTTPVSYAQNNNQVTIFTHANWWKNLRGGAPVSLRLRGKEINGMAKVIHEDKTAIAAALTEHLQKSHFDAQFYQVEYDEQGHPKTEDIQKAVQTVTVVQVSLT